MMRIALFLLTNLAVMVVFGLVLSLTGIQSSSMTGLLIMALLFGFGGSIVSLLMSKWMALKSVGGEVIEQPRNETERWLMNTVAQQARPGGRWHAHAKLPVRPHHRPWPRPPRRHRGEPGPRRRAAHRSARTG